MGDWHDVWRCILMFSVFSLSIASKEIAPLHIEEALSLSRGAIRFARRWLFGSELFLA